MVWLIHIQAIDVIRIIADFPDFKKLRLENGAFVSLAKMLKKAHEEELLERGTDALSSFCEDQSIEGQSLEDDVAVEMAMNILCEIVKQQTSETKLRSKILQTLLLLSENSKNYKETTVILQSELLSCLIQDLR